MNSEPDAVSGPFTAVQLHELKRQIELFQELNKNLRLILETGHSSSKRNNKPNKKIGTKSASTADITVPEGYVEFNSIDWKAKNLMCPFCYNSIVWH